MCREEVSGFWDFRGDLKVEVHSEKLIIIKTIACILEHEMDPGIDIIDHLYSFFFNEWGCFV